MKNKTSLKQRIYYWVKENSNEYVRLEDIKQTNISFRDNATNRESYYFQCGNWISPYTMKRWIEIAECKLYDTYQYKHGTWYWIKNHSVIN